LETSGFNTILDSPYQRATLAVTKRPVQSGKVLGPVGLKESC